MPPSILSAIIEHARTGYPAEVCGIIAGVGGEGQALHRGRNQSPTPHVAFELDAETVARQIEFEDQGLTLAAIYHSHPDGPEIPSTTDVRQAYYPDSIYLICSLADFARPVVRGFRIQNGSVSEVKLVSQR